MKIKPEHLQYLREHIGEDMPKNATERQRWDALHAAGLTPWVCKELYPYLNDSHIDTALRTLTN